MSGMKVVLIVALGFAFVGIIFIGVGIGISRSMSHKQEVCTSQVVAEVVEIKRVRTHPRDPHDYSVSWYPVYEYWADNQTVRVRSNIGGHENDFHIGQKVDLNVNPKNVNEFYNASDPQGLLGKIFTAVGIILVAGSVGVLTFGKMKL